MSNEIEKTRPTKIQRKDYLEKDKERFRDPSKAGAPKAMSVHDPYEPQWDPNPSGKATTTVIIEHSPVKPRDCRTIPAGSIVLDQNRHPVFETMETAVLDGASEAVVGAIACEAGAHPHLDRQGIQPLPGHRRRGHP